MKNFPILYTSGRVTRFHARDVQSQTVAQHSWGVAMVLAQIAPDNHNLLKAALLHDLAERATGDVPAPAKWASSKLDMALTNIEEVYHRITETAVELSDDEQKMLKWADMFELVLWCKHCMKMGNEYAREVYQNGLEWLARKDFPNEAAHTLYLDLLKE